VLTLLSKDGRRALPVAIVNGQESVALDDLAAAFQLTVREEAGAITVSYKGRTIVLTADQALASVSGRLVSLAAAPTRLGGRWLVPVEFIGRALALIYDTRLDLRRSSHLVVVGDLRVPRVTIRHEPLANAARLTIDTAPRATSTITQEAGRLLVKFDADAIDATIPVLQSQGIVTAIRAVDAVTIGVEVGPRFGAFRSSTEQIADTTRVVIDLVGAESSTTSALPAGAAPPPAPEVALPGQVVAAIRTIAVDAGHGGEDVGVKGDGGTAEKALTLAVARRLKTAVEERLGIRVLLTRDEDRNVPIDERAAIANNSKADLFISLHANAALRGTPSGASIHVAAFNTAQERQAKLAPERLPTFGGGLRDIELVEWDLAQLRYLDQSTELARIVREQFNGRVPLDAQQPAVAGPFRVLESANMPAVLIEMGYLSNADQEAALGSAEFQNTFAQAIMDAVVKFRDYLERQRAEGVR
jgi:N-acetylmuramoyl-L-alanine amidase